MNPVKNIRAGVFFALEGDGFFDLFNTDIRVAIEENASIEYAGRCAGYLNAMSDRLIEHLCVASIRYCNDFLAAIGGEPKGFAHPRDVLRLITPSGLSVPDPEHGNEPVIHLELNCEWEKEHGMEWVARGEQALYVGAYNGVNPWADYTPEDSWDYA